MCEVFINGDGKAIVFGESYMFPMDKVTSILKNKEGDNIVSTNTKIIEVKIDDEAFHKLCKIFNDSSRYMICPYGLISLSHVKLIKEYSETEVAIYLNNDKIELGKVINFVRWPKDLFLKHKNSFRDVFNENNVSIEKLKWENELMRNHIQHMPGGSQFFETFLHFETLKN